MEVVYQKYYFIIINRLYSATNILAPRRVSYILLPFHINAFLSTDSNAIYNFSSL